MARLAAGLLGAIAAVYFTISIAVQVSRTDTIVVPDVAAAVIGVVMLVYAVAGAVADIGDRIEERARERTGEGM